MSTDPNYELVARIWRDSVGSDDSVFVEVIDGELHLTVMIDEATVGVVLPPARVRDLRNALTRAEKRLS